MGLAMRKVQRARVGQRERERESPVAVELLMSGVVYRLKRSQTEVKHLTKTLSPCGCRDTIALGSNSVHASDRMPACSPDRLYSFEVYSDASCIRADASARDFRVETSKVS